MERTIVAGRPRRPRCGSERPAPLELKMDVEVTQQHGAEGVFVEMDLALGVDHRLHDLAQLPVLRRRALLERRDHQVQQRQTRRNGQRLDQAAKPLHFLVQRRPGLPLEQLHLAARPGGLVVPAQQERVDHGLGAERLPGRIPERLRHLPNDPGRVVQVFRPRPAHAPRHVAGVQGHHHGRNRRGRQFGRG